MTIKALSRGQKAAQTRAANKAKAAKAAKAFVKANAASKAERAKALNVKAKAKREAVKLAKAAELHALQVKAASNITTLAKAPRHLLRAAAVKAIVGGVQASKVYSVALAQNFPKFWEFQRAEINRKTNHGTLVADYFLEIDVFAENFKAAHIAAGKPGRANPSTYIANFKKYAKADANPNADQGKGSGNKIDALAAFKRDLPSLYLRANNAAEFENNPRLQEVARLAGMILTIVGADMQAINEKIGK